ncbi:MAG: hypothetical protein R3B09_34205, partial [Nannocystaceae bacterium]
VNYFLANGFAVGLGLSDTIFIYSRSLRAEYPGIEDQVATNLFRVMPQLQYVFLRNRWFSPYAFAGVGPVFLNNGGGTVGEWNAGPGAYIGLGGPVFLDVGVGFSARFPQSKCDDAFTYMGAVALDACSFRWGPRIGFVLAFGAGRSSAAPRRQRSAPPPQPTQTWEEPAPPPRTYEEPAPPPSPYEAPATAPEGPVAPPEEVPTDDAPAPLEPEAPEAPESAPSTPDQ